MLALGIVPIYKEIFTFLNKDSGEVSFRLPQLLDAPANQYYNCQFPTLTLPSLLLIFTTMFEYRDTVPASVV